MTIWYDIELRPEGNNYPYHEIMLWLNEQHDAGIIKHYYTSHYYYSFTREEDAVAFKLRWL